MAKNNYKTNKERARERAIFWQLETACGCLSYYELYTWQEYFNKLARRYGLIKEFKQNGII